MASHIWYHGDATRLGVEMMLSDNPELHYIFDWDKPFVDYTGQQLIVVWVDESRRNDVSVLVNKMVDRRLNLMNLPHLERQVARFIGPDDTWEDPSPRTKRMIVFSTSSMAECFKNADDLKFMRIWFDEKKV